MAREPSLARTGPQPVRTCIGCRERATKSELLRVVAGSGPDGQPAVVPDLDGTAPGRGAHLHPTPECYDLAVRRRAFARALRVRTGLVSTPVGDHLAAQRLSDGHSTTALTVNDRQELEQ